MSFDGPPARQQLALNRIAIAACSVGVLVFFVAAIVAVFDWRHDGDIRLIMNVIGMAICASMALPSFHAIRRLKHFGMLPITIDVHDGVLTLIEPMRGDVDARRIPANQVDRCSFYWESLSIFRPRLYRIRIVCVSGKTFGVRVAVSDRQIIARATEDLQNALRAAALLGAPAPCLVMR